MFPVLLDDSLIQSFSIEAIFPPPPIYSPGTFEEGHRLVTVRFFGLSLHIVSLFYMIALELKNTGTPKYSGPTWVHNQEKVDNS